MTLSAGVRGPGAQLARLEAAIALETLFDRFPNLATAGRPARTPPHWPTTAPFDIAVPVGF